MMIMVMKADDAGATATPQGRKRPAAGSPKTGLKGRRIGVYEVMEEIGRGGMGVVYKARDRSLDREVAIKVLLPELSRDEEFERRFVREARAAAKLDHPNIVQVYTAGRFEDVLFIAMQLVRGRSLAQVIRQKGRMPVREALRIVRQAAAALAEAHKASLVHRDVKPNNIMIDETGRVKIMDFGLMRSSLSREAITRSGEFFGTPEYASPEQCETSVLDGRSDIYSLGAVLYEMLTGRMPYSADTPMSLFRKILEEDPPPVRSVRPDVPQAVESLVRRMMAKRREDRFATAQEVMAAVDRILAGSTRAVPARRRRFPWAIAAAAAGAAALLLAAVALRPSKKVESPGPAARLEAPARKPEPKPDRMRLVVFDLKNGIPRPDTAWYEIALSDMLIAALSQQPFLEVPTRDMLLWKLKEMRLEGPVSGDDRRILTHELGAQAYLSGAYYVQGGKVRVTLSCYRLPENSLAFPARSFDRSEKELFALVDEVAREVAHELQGVAAGVVSDIQVAAEVRPARELLFAFGTRCKRDRTAGETAADPCARTAEQDVGEDVLAHAEKSQARSADGVTRQGYAGGKAGAGPPAKDERQRPPAAAAEAPPPAPEAPPGPKSRGLVAGAAGEELKAREDSEISRKGADKVAGAPEEAGAALRGRGRGENALRRSFAADEAGIAKAWYQNRQELEKFRRNVNKDQFEALSRALRSHFHGERMGEFWKGVEGGRENLDRVLKAAGVPGLDGVSVEFVCPGCQGISPSLAPCDKCDRYPIVRIRVAAPAPGKKE